MSVEANIKKSRMMVYLVMDTTLADDSSPEGKCKFGERFVTAPMTLDEAIADVKAYIRRSTFSRRGGVYDRMAADGFVYVWDASDYAEHVKRFRKHAKLDDLMRNLIDELRLSNDLSVGTEFHADSFDNLKIVIASFLSSYKQERMSVKFSTAQMEMMDEVLAAYNRGDKVVFAELCARFGKTLWSAGVGQVLNVDMIVVTSYVKTVFTSFASDLVEFEQFADLEHIETVNNPNYKEQIEEALAANKRIIVYLGINAGGERNERVDFVLSQNASKLLIVDEADFGVHTNNQASLLIDQLPNIDFTLLMTGTNTERAVGEWPVDSYVSTTYGELLMNRRRAEEALAA